METLNIHTLLLTFIKNNAFLFAIYFIFTFLQYPIHDIYIPDYYGRVINSFKDKTSSFTYFFKLLVLLYVLEWVFDGFAQVSLYYIAPSFSEFITGTMFEFIIDNYELDFDNIPVGEILSKIIRIPNILFDYINMIKYDVLRYIFVFANGFIHYYGVSTKLSLIYSFIVALNYIFIYVMFKNYNFYEKKSNYYQDHIYELLIDCLNNLTSIYAFNQEEEEKQNFYSKTFAKFKKILYATKSVSLSGNLIWGISMVLAFLVMNYVMFQSYLKKEINAEKTISTFIITFSLIRMLENAEKLSYGYSRIYSQIKDSEDFFNNISDVNRNEMKMDKRTFKNGDIVYSHVYHKYKDTFVLENVNLTIQKGENVAFIGQIGSGKSTMIKLLLGFQPLRMGHITIGCVDTNEISNKELRKYIFYIPQKPKLFNRTLYENIVYGLKKPPSKDSILKLLEDLGLEDLMQEFGEKMDVSVGVEGNKLSGGQRQIVWLMRSMFRPSYILVLDEPTASLDPANKKKMISVIQKMSVGKTVIIVSHDDIDPSFRKVQFNEGRIVENSFF
jgi:ABC-type multidrug transport system fused ATPase/permease subunit